MCARRLGADVSFLTRPSKRSAAPKAGAVSCRNAGFRIVADSTPVGRLQCDGILTWAEPWCVCVHACPPSQKTQVSVQVSGLVIGCRHLILEHLVTVSASTASLKRLALHHALSRKLINFHCREWT